MKTSRILVSLLLSTAAISAQTNFKSALQTQTNYGNFAVQGNAVGFQSVPAKTDVPASQSFGVSATTSAGGVDTIVGYYHRKGDVITVDVSEQGAATVSANQRPFRGGSTSSPSAKNVTGGRHSLLLTIRGQAGASAVLEFWGAGVTDRGVKVGYAYDVGNDGSVDYAFTPPDFTTRILPVVMPRNGTLEIKITSTVVVDIPTGGSARYKTGASLRFTPGPHCAVQPYGQGCGPRLSGVIKQPTATRHQLDLAYTGGSKQARGLIVFGTTFQRIPLPGTTCRLLTDPLIVFGFATDANGDASWSLAYPRGIVADVKLQAADLAGGRIHASNGLHVLCVR